MEPSTTNPVRIDAPAPTFALETIDSAGRENRMSLGSFAGSWLMLFFYPRDFSFVCPTEINAFSARYDEFTSRSCQMLGVSIDPLSAHGEWLRTPISSGGVAGLRFPLATDPAGTVSKAYGLWDGRNELPHRGLFLIDPQGVIRYSLQHGGAVGRSVDETLRVLDALQSGGLCPASWALGDGTLDVRSLLQPGRVLGHYRIETELGSGAFASVFRARDLRLERTVAVKVLRDLDTKSRESLMAEARTSASIQHPNVCPVYAAEDVDGLSLIAMEYLDGPPLSQFAVETRLTLKSAFTLASKVAHGLDAAHRMGLAHGDLKPANVIVSSIDRPVLVDFGLAAAYRRALGSAPSEASKQEAAEPSDPDATTQVFAQPSESLAGQSSQNLAGTPAYMSPEQAIGDPPSSRSDVFSLGLVLFEMVTGERLLSGKNVVDLLESLRSTRYMQRLVALDDEPTARVLNHLLSPNPNDRPTADEAASLLEYTATMD